MSDLSSFRKEEDEMLRYAHVERTVKKVYAFRYQGYIDEVPYFFTKDILDRNKLRGRQDVLTLTFMPEPGRFGTCRVGDWIVIDSKGKTRIMPDRMYRHLFMPLRDLDY